MSKVNKSKTIRDYRAAHPRASYSEISNALQSKGVDVTPNYIGTIIHSMRKNAAKTQGETIDPFLQQAYDERNRLQTLIDEHKSVVQRLKEVNILIAKLEG